MKHLKHLLFLLYFPMRFIKAPLFNTVIKPYYKWIKDEQSIWLDAKYLFWICFDGLSFFTADFYFSKWYLGLIPISIGFLINLALNFDPEKEH